MKPIFSPTFGPGGGGGGPGGLAGGGGGALAVTSADGFTPSATGGKPSVLSGASAVVGGVGAATSGGAALMISIFCSTGATLGFSGAGGAASLAAASGCVLRIS